MGEGIGLNAKSKPLWIDASERYRQQILRMVLDS